MATGRPRQTVQSLKLSGMYGKRSSHKGYNEETPMKIETEEKAPARYLKRTQTAWQDFMKVKSFQGVLSIEDKTAITLMFDSLDSYYRVHDQLQRIQKAAKTEDYRDKDFLNCLKTLSATQDSFFTSYVKLACRFGITPSERTRLKIESPKPKSDMMKLIESVQENNRKAALSRMNIEA